MFHSIRRVLSIIFLLISIVLIVWASLPNKRQTEVLNLSTEEMRTLPVGQGSQALGLPARQVVLEWPDSMRIGEDETISLVFEPVVTDSGNLISQAGYSDVYSLYNLMAEARFDVSGVSVTPENPVREAMPAGQLVKFTWKVKADEGGSYDGTVWLSLRYLPLNGGQASQVPVYIQQIKIQTSSLFGLNELKAYLWGGIGIVFAAVIDYDDLVAFIQSRIRKKTTKVLKDTKE